MKLGMNLLLFTTQPDESTFPIAEKLKGMGYDGLEWPILGTDRATAEKIAKFNKDNGLEATTVYVFGPGNSPISEDPGQRQAAMQTLTDRIEICAALGSKLLCGPIVQPLGHFTGSPRTAEEWARCVGFFQEAGEIAAKHDVTLVIEYLNRFEIYFLNTAADAVQLCNEIDHPNVKTMIDSFHANIEEKNLYDAVMAVKPQLAHIHISEHDRGVPGSSTNIQWDDFFRGVKESGYDGWLTIESFGTALPDLAAAAKIWRPLFNDPDEVCRDGLAFIKKMIG